jgi:putative addiction module killer protein
LNSTWTIKHWLNTDEINCWFDSLGNDKAKSVAKELKLLQGAGNELRLPHSKALGQGLFELREKRFGYRIYYTFCEGRVIILLTAGDKSSQKRDIRVARERLETFLKHEVNR